MILIIGATSFIGVYVVDELVKNGYEVAVTGRNDKFREYYKNKNILYYNVDISEEKDFLKLPKTGVTGVILLAGLLPANVVAKQGEEIGAQYFIMNTIGTINVLEYCRKNKIQRVISTCSYADVINSWTKGRPITESEPRNYRYNGDHAVYVFSKNAANDMLEYYNQEYGMKNAVFRFPMVLGVGPHGYYSVNGEKIKSGFQVFLDRASIGEDICIYGDSEISRDVVYVKDVAQAFCKAINSPNTYGLYNITSGVELTLLNQAKIMAEVFFETKKSEITFKPEISNKSKSFLFSISKAKKDFDYQPNFSDFKVMLIDYKMMLKKREYNELFKYI